MNHTMDWTKPKEPYFGLKGGWLTFWITVACATDMAMFGDLCLLTERKPIPGGVVVTEDFLVIHGLMGDSKTNLLSTVSAIYTVGCFFGAIIAFSVGERQGRKRCIMIGTTIMAVGTILISSSFSLAQMFVGRIVLGLGNGMNTVGAPIWQTETATAEWRGKLVIIEMMTNVAGFAFVNWLNYGLSFVGGGVAWRFPLAFQFIFIFILWITVPWLPESPRWLIAHERREEALAIVASLEDKGASDPAIIAQVREIEYSVQYEREHMVRWRDLLRGKSEAAGETKTLRRVILGAGTQFIQQFEGINISTYYLPKVLESYLGLSNSMSRLITAVNATSYLVFSCCAVPLVEKWGRRLLMFISTIGMAVCLLCITILLRYAEGNYGERMAKAAIPFFFLYFIFFGSGMLGVPWLYPTEINSLPMRTKGAAVATATNWITNFVVVEITPIGLQNIGWRFWIVWTVLNAVFAPIIWFIYPETANRQLEDMDAYFRENPSLLVTKDLDAISIKRPLKYIAHENSEIREVRQEIVELYQDNTGVSIFEHHIVDEEKD